MLHAPKEFFKAVLESFLWCRSAARASREVNVQCNPGYIYIYIYIYIYKVK